MSKVYNTALQARLEQHLAETGISQAKLAPFIGVSQTALSQYRRSKYDNGDIAELERKVEEFFKVNDMQAAAAEKAAPYKATTEYVATSISEDVYRSIQYIQLERGMAVLHGDAGIGKTKGAAKFVKENSNAIYIEATPSSGTLAGILKLLARELHISAIRNKLDLVLAIREKLENTNKVIIIDEAQHLKLGALEELRALSDDNSVTGAKGVGICLIGNTDVYNRMMGKQEAQFAQLFSRIRMNRHYSTGKVTRQDVKALFPRLPEDSSKRELDLLFGVCQSKWGIRGAVNIYNNAVNNEAINYDGLYSMAHTMGVGLIQ